MRPTTTEIAHKNGLNHNFAYFDSDIDTLSKSLATRDGITFYITGDPNPLTEDSTRQETGISTVNGKTIIELPAISSAETSPPALRIKEQLEHLKKLTAESEEYKTSKSFTASYPLKILAPYKLGGSFHWNVLEIIINEENGYATCKRYDTNGSSYSVEDDIFNNIKEGLQGHFSSIDNQLGSKKEYEKGFQWGNNCGLVSALVMHDLRKGDIRSYDGRINDEGFPGSLGLRQHAYGVVQTHGSNAQKNNFCKPLNEINFINNQLELENANPDTKKRNDIKDKLIKSTLTENQIAILNQCRAKGDNNAEKLKLLRLPSNTSILGNILPILFTKASLDLKVPENYIIQEHALDAIDLALIDLSKAKSAIPEINSALESAISSLLLYVSDHGNEPLHLKESADYFNILQQDLGSKEVAEFQEFSRAIKISHQQKVEDAKKVLKKPITSSAPKIQNPLSPLETKILKRAYQKGAVNPTLKDLIPIIKQDQNSAIKDIAKSGGATPPNSEFLKPRTYGGIGAEIDISYNKTQKRFEFKVTQVLAGSLAQELGLKVDDKITYKSEENNNTTLQSAILAIRQIALKEDGTSNDSGSNIDLIKGSEPGNLQGESNAFVEFARGSSPVPTEKILIHEKTVCRDAQSLIEAIEKTRDGVVGKVNPFSELAGDKPSTSPGMTRNGDSITKVTSPSANGRETS